VNAPPGGSGREREGRLLIHERVAQKSSAEKVTEKHNSSQLESTKLALRVLCWTAFVRRAESESQPEKGKGRSILKKKGKGDARSKKARPLLRGIGGGPPPLLVGNEKKKNKETYYGRNGKAPGAIRRSTCDLVGGDSPLEAAAKEKE